MLSPLFGFFLFLAVLIFYLAEFYSLKKFGPDFASFPTTNFLMAAAECGSVLPFYDKLLLLSSRSFKIWALSYSKSVIIPIFFLAYSSVSLCFARSSTPDTPEIRGRVAWYREGVSSGFDLSDDFYDTYEQLDLYLEYVLLSFFLRSAEILEIRTRYVLLLFLISSSSEFTLCWD